jgi:hypothetical protein
MRTVSSDFAQGSKLKYEKPQLVRIGTLETITRHASDGYALDQSFPGRTPQSQLTFSD